ncbi:hypothetical protein X747_24715 [Mesorhizobium sp. LNJC384A00]|uniref:hypothetical protein n=1 Tax=Mesorhizobium sp. LNJC384A00 TaxID=1287268 RepID=UPI0003CF204E|nr:hypothetical protein [Mesorhizobium sp. LNJC384A00]ESY37877.1 hypothetical protein X747_24715 [Mesorhizobium sp. LNJC384A00]
MTDLTGSRAKLKWADNQITILGAQITAFMAQNVYEVRTPPNSKMRRATLYRNNVTVPDDIKTATGMIVQAQRDSLDHLVVALARRKNAAVRETIPAFPICDSGALFADRANLRKIADLSDIDRAAIVALKPYKGGNNLLYALHWLSNKSKHRDLITATQHGVGAAFTTIGSNGYVRKLTLNRAEGPDGTPMAVVKMEADPQIRFELSHAVSFREIPEAGSRPVIEMLRGFSKIAGEIIDGFDI